MRVRLLSITDEADKLIEEAGRVCWRSEERITPDTASGFVKMLIDAGHLSVLEHATAVFHIEGVSRALTHQLVRHRLCSFSQQSQRYVSEENFEYIIPEKIQSDTEALSMYNDIMLSISGAYSNLISMGIKKEDARYLLPNATRTTLAMGANFRQLRHMLSLRGSPKAQLEIRLLFIEILKILKEKAPASFYDFSYDEEKRVILQNKGDGR